MIIIVVINTLAKDYTPVARDKVRTWEQKIYIAVCHDWRYIRTWLAQFVNLLPRRGPPGSVPAPTRFSKSACCAGYCRDNGPGRERRTRGRRVPANFHRKPAVPPTSAWFFRRAREIWSALEYLCAAMRCTYTSLTWITLFEFPNEQNIRDYPFWSGFPNRRRLRSLYFELKKKEKYKGRAISYFSTLKRK